MVPDYKALYFALFRASAQAAEQLIAAQQQAEAMFCDEAVQGNLVFLQEGQKNQPPPTSE